MNKAAFLDRDGVINIDKDYVSKIEDFEFKEGIFELLGLLHKLKYELFIVTNQSGIGRGYYSIDDFERLTNWMLEELKKRGIDIKEVFYCPHSPESSCECRKPSPFMIESAAKKYDIDLKNSLIIGDKDSDMRSGLNAGVATRIFVGGKKNETPINATFEATNLYEIISFLEGKNI